MSERPQRRHPARVKLCGLCAKGLCDEHYIEWLREVLERLASRHSGPEWRDNLDMREITEALP